MSSSMSGLAERPKHRDVGLCHRDHPLSHDLLLQPAPWEDEPHLCLDPDLPHALLDHHGPPATSRRAESVERSRKSMKIIESP